MKKKNIEMLKLIWKRIKEKQVFNSLLFEITSCYLKQQALAMQDFLCMTNAVHKRMAQRGIIRHIYGQADVSERHTLIGFHHLSKPCLIFTSMCSINQIVTFLQRLYHSVTLTVVNSCTSTNVECEHCKYLVSSLNNQQIDAINSQPTSNQHL